MTTPSRMPRIVVGIVAAFALSSCGGLIENQGADSDELRKSCGNGVCDRRENCNNCARDCGECVGTTSTPDLASAPDAGVTLGTDVFVVLRVAQVGGDVRHSCTPAECVTSGDRRVRATRSGKLQNGVPHGGDTCMKLVK